MAILLTASTTKSFEALLATFNRIELALALLTFRSARRTTVDIPPTNDVADTFAATVSELTMLKASDDARMKVVAVNGLSVFVDRI